MTSKRRPTVREINALMAEYKREVMQNGCGYCHEPITDVADLRWDTDKQPVHAAHLSAVLWPERYARPGASQ